MMAAQTPDQCDPLLSTLRSFLQALPTTPSRLPTRLLVAVSGGSDSKGLLIALHALLKDETSLPVTLAAATIDHGLRPESAQEAADVAALCETLGIAHVTKRWEGPKPKTGLSSAARNARYKLLSEAAASLKADIILTGHTADDQAETIAMRQSRNQADTALGLSGMADHMLYDNRIWIYRPLLTCRRQMIRDFLTARRLDWVEDPSNSNPNYERARVRAQLSQHHTTPLPCPQNRLILSKQAANLLSTHAHMPVPGVVLLRDAAFNAPPAVLGHALQALLATLGGQTHGPSEPSLRSLMDLAPQSNGSRITLGRCLGHRHRQGILLVREARGVQPLILAPGQAGLWDGRWWVENSGNAPLRISANPGMQEKTTSQSAVVPASIMALGRQSMPQLEQEADAAGWQISEGGDALRLISPYARFLPGFDWPLASTLARLFGAKPFFPPYF
jgi:tRNA(Ile)-lysidine synthase